MCPISESEWREPSTSSTERNEYHECTLNLFFTCCALKSLASLSFHSKWIGASLQRPLVSFCLFSIFYLYFSDFLPTFLHSLLVRLSFLYLRIFIVHLWYYGYVRYDSRVTSTLSFIQHHSPWWAAEQTGLLEGELNCNCWKIWAFQAFDFCGYFLKIFLVSFILEFIGISIGVVFAFYLKFILFRSDFSWSAFRVPLENISEFF